MIKPTLAEGRTVISDRYADATRAYQGSGRGFSRDIIDQAIELATGGLEPDLTIFFDLPVESALERMSARNESGERTNRMDFETVEFYERVRAAYLDIAVERPETFCILDANRSVEEIHADVSRITSQFLNAD